METREGEAVQSRGGSRSRLLRIGFPLLLAVLSFAFAAGAFELGLRFLGYEAIYDVYSKPSVLWRADPLLGWRHEAGSRTRYVGPRPWPIEFENDIQINSLGLRGSEIDALPSDGVRVLFLGDSVVAAFEVSEPETFVHLIGRKLSAAYRVPVQTINGGVRGYGTDQSLLWYREIGRKLDPDIVMFIHSGNDPRNNMTLHRLRRPFGKAAFAPAADGILTLVGVPVPKYSLCESYGLDGNFRPVRRDSAVERVACMLETRLADHSALFTFAAMQIRRSPRLMHLLHGLGGAPEPEHAAAGRRPGERGGGLARIAGWLPFAARPARAEVSREPEPDPSWQLTSTILAQLASEVTAEGAELLIVVREVAFERMDGAAIRARGASIHHPRFGALTAEAQITFKNDGHLNALGHKGAATALARELAPAVARVIRRRPIDSAADLP